MADAKLTITVSADVKKAAQQLQSLGYNISDVKKNTDKANESADLWSKTLKKGAHDNVEQLVNLGAKFLTLTTVATAAYKGIKSCVSEALKENDEAKKQLDKISSAWTEIKKNLGTALLNTVTPALETLYKAISGIAKLCGELAAGTNYSSMLIAAEAAYSKGGTYDVSGMSKTEVEYALGHLPDNDAWSHDESWIHSLGNSLVERLADINSGVGVADNGKHAYDALTSYDGRVSKWIPTINKDMANARKLLAEYTVNANAYTGEEENYWQKAADSVSDYIEALKDAKEKQTELIDNIALLGNEAMNIYKGVSALLDQTTENEIKNIEESTASQEEKDLRIEELERKQFDRQKRLSLAEATMSAAQAMLEIYAKYAATPWLMWTLLGTTAVSTGLEIATISQQNFAQGGIVSGPTRALIGEGGEKEAVMPLSKLDEFVNRPESTGTIVVNVSINGSGNGTAEDVYYAIERAQRTGLLPKWRYA